MNKEARVGLFILIAIGILFYLSINIGALHIFSTSTATYKTFFDDVAGLERKASVKMSGFTVGRVEDIQLHDNGKAEVTLSINRAYKLFKNSYTTITQDSFLGNKVLEIDPGDSTSGLLPPGSTLHMPGRANASLADILETVQDTTSAVQEVVYAFNHVFASTTGEERMKKVLEDLSAASNKMSSITAKVDTLVDNNKDKVNLIGDNLNKGIADFSQFMPDIKTVVSKAKEDYQEVATDIKNTAHDASATSKAIRSVTEKIEKGEGTIGKLIHEEDLYQSVKESADGIRSLVGQANKLEIVLDGHNEQYRRIHNSRGEINFTLKFREDYFYLLQLSSDEMGTIKHSRTYNDYLYEDGVTKIDRYKNAVGVNNSDRTMGMDGYELSRVAPVVQHTYVDFSGIKKGLQIAKKFDRIVLRVGMFENTFGGAIDLDVPLQNKNLRWVTTVEAFDFSGNNRLKDDRPHIRWSNKLFFFKNIYTYFGVDDIVSRRTAAPFWGAGITFNDDDIKFLLYSLMGKSV